MAIKTVRTDDLDGSSDAELITFSLRGEDYEIDLSTRNLEKLEGAMAPFIDAARHVKQATGTKRPTVAAVARQKRLDDVRTWARENGHEVSSRGRIPQAILDAYDAR